MSIRAKDALLFALVVLLILATGFVQSWNSALIILNMGLISAIMAMGVNLQWGFAGLFNVGIMGFVALGGLGVVITSAPPVSEAWRAGGPGMLLALALFGLGSVGLVVVYRVLPKARWRFVIISLLSLALFGIYRIIYTEASGAIEDVNPALTGYLGGLGLPVLLSWPVGGAIAALAAWFIGKTALGLRSDYLAIATLGISEIVIAILKNEDWLTRGVKNVIGLPRPVPYETDLQASSVFVERAAVLSLEPVSAAAIFVKLCYALLFSGVLIVLYMLLQRSLHSPWGRMMRAIRDNEHAAAAMGKNVTARHLQVFVLGSAICGVAGAMMTTLDSQLTPGSYHPLRYTFLIWVMVIVGGSGNNLGAILGGFLIWFLWVQAEPIGQTLVSWATASFDDTNPIKMHLLKSVAHTRLLMMGVLLLLVLRFFPKGLIPER